jgi:hypothetical protein
MATHAVNWKGCRLSLTFVAIGAFLGHPGLVSATAEGQNRFMTIKYANGTVCKAIVLSHDQDEVRAGTAGSDDAQILRRVKGTWFSEAIEPVAIEFEWQRTGRETIPSVKDCICSKLLAAHLIQRLLAGSDGDDPVPAASACRIRMFTNAAIRDTRCLN